MSEFEDEDILAKLTTRDGLVFIRKSVPETLTIARKLIDLTEKRLERGQATEMKEG